MATICGHFDWTENVSYIEAIIDVFVLNDDFKSIPNIFALCVNCALKVLIETNNLQTLFHYYSKHKQHQIDTFKKEHNQLIVLDDALQIDHLITITAGVGCYPQILDYFCEDPIADFDKFKQFFFGILSMQMNWCISSNKLDQGGHEIRVKEAAKFIGIIVFQYFTLKNIVTLCQIEPCFVVILFYKQNVFSICKYIERFASRSKQIKHSMDWRKELHSDYLKMGKFCHISAHILILLYIYSRSYGNNTLISVIKNKEMIRLKKIFKRIDFVKEQLKELYFMNKCIGKSHMVCGYSLIRCGNEKCNKPYLKYGAEYKKLYKSKNVITDFSKYQKNKWFKCRACRMVFYCCRKCQKYDWNRSNHKHICKTLSDRYCSI
eukprot:357432_1